MLLLSWLSWCWCVSPWELRTCDFTGGHSWFNNVRLEVWKLTSHVEDFWKELWKLGKSQTPKHQASWRSQPTHVSLFHHAKKIPTTMYNHLQPTFIFWRDKLPEFWDAVSPTVTGASPWSPSVLRACHHFQWGWAVSAWEAKNRRRNQNLHHRRFPLKRKKAHLSAPWAHVA